MVPLLLVLLLQFAQQLCGVSIIICYTDELFSKVPVILIFVNFFLLVLKLPLLSYYPVCMPRCRGTACLQTCRQ